MGWFLNILIKALYGVAGIFAAWLGTAANVVPPPETGDLASQIWFTLIAALLTGFAAQIKRWIQRSGAAGSDQ